MTMERSSTIMDAIFASSEEESRGRLLKIMQDFLTSEASKHSAKEKGSDNSFSICCMHAHLQQRMQKEKQSRQMLTWTNLLETPMVLRIRGMLHS